MDIQTDQIAPPQKKRGQRFVSWIFILLGIFLLLLMLMAITLSETEPQPEPGAVAILIFVLGIPALVFLVVGVLWLRSIKGKERKGLHRYQERLVLRSAAANGGTVTVAQLMHETPFSSEEVEETLARLCEQSVAHPELLDDGGVSYRFAGLPRAGNVLS